MKITNNTQIVTGVKVIIENLCPKVCKNDVARDRRSGATF